ncbi:MAG TPA: beta-ketoacyl synthase N-terminal-like domain-containing protein [Kofleriaceae bacterium]|nr:beta-ketoacyl synthase N-terminal-like domain-containing protein [Kofleriaceae bacterium]
MTDARSDRAVAVVGLAGRFPGAGSVDRLWHNLLARVDGVRRFSREELEAAGELTALLDDPDYVPVKGVLDGIEQFDARFFDYSAREAQLMDPQHRLFLEAAWHALERAGFDPARGGKAAGVFASAGMSTYLLELAGDPALRRQVGLFDLFLHNAPDYLATRVSYKAGLTGPSFTVQTGCSSSLVAIHLACQSLLDGECDLALAGGATVRAPQLRGYVYDAGGALSRDGTCRPFDADATGTVPGEAVAVVALKRIEDALRDRDRVHAVIVGSAVNNDGSRKVGYTAPSVEGQCNAIAEALEVARVSARTIGYVEAHGTATRLGDPLEVAALSKAFGAHGPDRQYCALGSIKSNIGHTDAAAGAAGFVKAVLAIEHGAIPATLHYRTPNPQIDLADSPFFVNRETAPWPSERPRRAGVSAFGIGGTNAHVILEQAPAPAPRATVQVPRDPQVIVVSARTPAALDRMTAELCVQLDAPAADAAPLVDVAFTSQLRRRAFEHRRAIVAATAGAACRAIRAADPAAIKTGQHTPRAIAFLFPGGGTQYPNMGRELYESEPVFRGEIDRCCEIVRPHIGIDLRTLLYPEPADLEAAADRLRQVTYGVPAIWMTDYALARLLIAWGLEPLCMLGHSLGEYVAACVSGVMSVADSLTLATHRALLCERSAQGRRGASLSVSLGERELRPLLPPGVEIGVVNAPASCVAAGPAPAIGQLEQRLTAEDVPFRRLNITAAVHSSAMDPLMEDVRRLASGMTLARPRIPYYSNPHGRLIASDDLTPDYWAQHLRRTVRFSDCVADLVTRPGQPPLALLEVGPGTSLVAAVVEQVTPERNVVLLPTMRHARDPRGDREVLAQCVAGAWVHGVDIDWRAVHGEGARPVAPFPVYSFEPSRHWIEPTAARAPANTWSGAPAEVAVTSGDEAVASAPAASRPVQLPPDLRDDALAIAAAEVWRDHLGVTALEADSSFFALGGTSLAAVRLLAALQRRLRPARRLVLEDLLRAPGFAGFVERLRGAHCAGAGPGAAAPRGAPDPASSLVLLRPGTAPDRPPLFIVHPAGGHVFHYRRLAAALDPRITVFGLKAPGLDDDLAPLTSIEELAAHHLRAVRAAGAAGPHHLAGSSFGGCVAYEMAQRLRADGAPVALLAMLDTPAPDDLPVFEDHADYVDYLFGDMWGQAVGRDELRALPEPERIPHALRKTAARGIELGFEPAMAERILTMFVTNERAMRGYQPRALDGRVVYFRARERRRRDPHRPELGWARHVADMTVEIVPGDHVTMHEPPHVAELARRLDAHLTDSPRGTHD